MSLGKGHIEIAGVAKSYDGFTYAVDGVNLKIPDGAYCCILGPSGCGKTTILRMIAGHEDPTVGERRTAMMFQSYALFPHLTVRDNIAFALRVRGLPKTERYARTDAMIEKVRMTEFSDRLPAQLSGGQQQRVALARAAITEPRVLLLDEPLSALDEHLRVRMRAELRRMQRELGITFVHVTHTQLEAIAVADQVVVMDKGRIAQSASPREIYAQPRTEYVAAFIGGQNVLHGRVAAVTESSITLQGAQGDCYLLPHDTTAGGTTVTTGQSVSFAVRRDRMRVTGEHGALAPAPNTLRGRVRELEYQGIYMKVSLVTDDPAAPGCVVYVEENTFFNDPVSVGQRVRCHWDPTEAHSLAPAA
jgi:putative spermidine/putrescine transport system ATP-binding protein